MKFSFCIPVYNGEGHLEAAIRRLQSQEFSDWEAVVVDDGSTDGTPALADAIAAADSRVRTVHQPNAGVAAARNRALDEARGDWIAWLDADDAYVDGALSRMAGLVDSHPGCNCLHFPYLEARPGGEPSRRVDAAHASADGNEMCGAAAFDLLYANRETAGINWQPWRHVYRRDSLPRFRAGKIHEDVDVLPLHLAGLDRVCIVGEPFYVYTPAREGSLTGAFSPKRVWDILEATGHVYGCMESSALAPEARRGFASMLAVNLFGYYLATPSFDEPDRSRLLDAFAEHPEWLTAIDWPRKTGWLKRLAVRVLGVRGAAKTIYALKTLAGRGRGARR